MKNCESLGIPSPSTGRTSAGIGRETKTPTPPLSEGPERNVGPPRFRKSKSFGPARDGTPGYLRGYCGGCAPPRGMAGNSPSLPVPGPMGIGCGCGCVGSCFALSQFMISCRSSFILSGLHCFGGCCCPWAGALCKRTRSTAATTQRVLIELLYIFPQSTKSMIAVGVPFYRESQYFN